MTRLVLLLAALAALAGLAVATVEVRTDADAVFDGAAAQAIERGAGRTLVVLVEPGQPDGARAGADTAEAGASISSVAVAIDAALATDPLVAPPAANASPPSALLDWLWENRFRIAPPATADLRPETMVSRLTEAKERLASAEGMLVADRLLTDPTGSFARLVDSVMAASGDLDAATAGPGWRTLGGGGALRIATLADRPLATAEVAALADGLRSLGEPAGARVHVTGPRVVAAEIAEATAHASMTAAAIAGGLLLLFLAWSLRSGTAVVGVLLTVGLGLAAASLAVQAVFGSVHIIALGFGGALAGLAIDYPLHMAAHGGGASAEAARRRATRLVRIGALTTAIGFLAISGSGIPALMQTGVFVATGLATAALVAPRSAFAGATLRRTRPDISLPAPEAGAHASGPTRAPRALPLDRVHWHLPWRGTVETVLAAAGLAVLAFAPPVEPRALVEPPPVTAEALSRVAALAELPSGRHHVRIEGSTLDDLLSRGHDLRPLLDRAVERGLIAGYGMLAAHLPERSGPTVRIDAQTFAERARSALAAAGLDPSFAARQTEAYVAALAAPPLGLADLRGRPETAPLAASLEETEAGLTERVALTGVRDPAALAALLAGTGATVVDSAEPIARGLAEIRRQCLLWLGVGALAGLGCLVAGLGSPARALSIGRTCAGALGATTVTIALVSGPPGIFEIVALTLVAGIGVDYGLFLSAPGSSAERRLAARSVSICAASTLIAFAAMVASDVRLLRDIGMTVSLGVIVTLALCLASRPARESHGVRA